MGRSRYKIRPIIAALLVYALFIGGIAAGAKVGFLHISPAAGEELPAPRILLAADPAPKEQPGDKPLAVVYCTHTSEEYAGQKRAGGVAGGVFSAAKALAAGLEGQGIGCILLDTVFDAPDWNKAYGNSLAALEKVKKEHPEIELFVDVHRDSPVAGLDTHYHDDSGDYARMMLIIGSDANLEHPNWQKNKTFAYALQDKINAARPGLMRDARIYSGRYNQHMGNKAILVEIGSNENTVDEACASAEVLARALAELLAQDQANILPDR